MEMTRPYLEYFEVPLEAARVAHVFCGTAHRTSGTILPSRIGQASGASASAPPSDKGAKRKRQEVSMQEEEEGEEDEEEFILGKVADFSA